MDGGAWWAVVHGVANSQTRLSDFTFNFQFHALEKEMAIHSSVLAWRIPGTGEPGGLPSMGSHRVGHDWHDLAAAKGWKPAFKMNRTLRGGQVLALGKRLPLLALSRAHTATCWTSHTSPLPLRVHLETHAAFPADWLLTLDRLFFVFDAVICKRNSDFLAQNSLQPDTKERQIGIHARSVGGGEPRVQGNILWGSQGRGRQWQGGHVGLRGYLGETTAPENPFVYSSESQGSLTTALTKNPF